MLRIIYSNRIEALAARLARETARPLGRPLAPEQVVVQNPGMAQWLTQALAAHHGICANVEFPLVASFVWRVFEGQLGDVPPDNPYRAEVLTQRCMAALPGLAAEPGFEEVRRYLGDDPDGRKLHRLGARCAGLFDQYLVYRPDWINRWDAGAETHWQARLWRHIAPTGPPRHRAALLAALMETCRAGRLEPDRLPERVAVFGLSALAPAYLDVLAGVAARVPVDLYVLNPSLAYWGDIASDRELARRRDVWRRLGRPDLSAYYDVGHPLLAALGGQGQAFFDQLQELGAPDEELFADPGTDCRLHRLQQDILLLRDRRREGGAGAPGADHSLQVHGGHSALREVQILQDRLLALFEALPGLLPRDVIVMAPDIGRFAPHVEAVFGTAPAPRHIPFTVADRGLEETDPHIAGVLALLSLHRGRMEASAVLGLLDLAALRRRFGIALADLPAIHDWVRDSGIRWGIDGAHRRAAGLPPDDRNSWRFGLRRLLLGYAMPDGADAVAGVLPLPGIEGGGAAPAGALADLVDALDRWRSGLATPATARRWRERLTGLVATFFDPADGEWAPFQELRLVADDLAREAEIAGDAVSLTPEVFLDVLRQRLGARDSGQGFLAGQVTFCNMVPMRSIPFRVVCLVGMNDREFPRFQHPPGFDLMAAAPRRGDRSRRDDDRFLFLEALLGARDVFYVSYQSRDVRDNSERVPSMVVGDLMDYVRRAEPDGAPDLFHQHPLQPFSHRCFAGGPLASYAEQWLPVPGPGRPAFGDPALPEPGPEEREVDLAELVDFFANPARHLLRRRLGVALSEGAGAVADSEPFLLDPLERYRLRQQALESGGLEPDAILARLEGAGAAPHGHFAQLAVADALAPVEPLVQAVVDLTAESGRAVEVDLAIAGFRLTGWLAAARAGGLVRYRPARMKARDRVGLWLEHLVLCATAPPGVDHRSRLLMLDGDLVLGPVAAPEPLLTELLGCYGQGLTRPLAFFPETSWAFAEAVRRGRDRERARTAAWRRWQDGYAHDGEGGDPYIDTAWRGAKPLGEAFEDLALRILTPLMDHRGD